MCSSENQPTWKVMNHLHIKETFNPNLNANIVEVSKNSPHALSEIVGTRGRYFVMEIKFRDQMSRDYNTLLSKAPTYICKMK